MNIKSSKSTLSGTISVPTSKSHTIRALIFASFGSGVSKLINPLPSADCHSAASAVKLFGANVDFGDESKIDGQVWTVNGTSGSIKVPSETVDVGNSGSTLYFLSPVAATLSGRTTFTGDKSICSRPVDFLADAINQMGSKAECMGNGGKTCPIVIDGKNIGAFEVSTDGAFSQYISGMMMAASRLEGTTKIHLSNPKETPYLTMTKIWLQSLGVNVKISDDFKEIEVTGPCPIESFQRPIPSDWSACAFPIVAGIITGSEISIPNADDSGTQGDAVIVENLKKLGAKLSWDKETKTVKTEKCIQKLECPVAENGKKEIHLNLSSCPDSICATAVAACFTDGTVYLEDMSVCRHKETDRIAVMMSELRKLGADVEDGPDSLIIHGVAGGKNLHGGIVESYEDHRIAMAFAVLGLGLKDGESVEIKDAECCKVSFPNFFEKMSALGANFQ